MNALDAHPDFNDIIQLIETARQKSYQAVNTQLIDLYWRVGAYISRKIASAEWGDGVVTQLAAYISHVQPNLKGFTRPNLFRMRQFYEAYRDDQIVSALLRQLPWTQNLTILSRSKRPEERAFYLRAAISEKWSSRELERQFNSTLFERTILNPPSASAALKTTHPEAMTVFKDSYMLEFLSLPEAHSEADLHRGLIEKLKQFLLELGGDFCFVGSQFPLQVGKQDFYLDLLFYHRNLNCLVAIELKANRFQPGDLGQLNFYLEALDRDHRKPHENPAIGLLLCASKDEEVAEYALSRSLSPTLIARYETQLPDKKLLQAKLHEFNTINLSDTDSEAN